MVGFGPTRERERILRILLLAGMTVAVAGGCATRGGIYHQVGPGENLFRIGKAYGIPYQKLGRINNIRDPNRIDVGQRIFIPRATRQLPVRVITPEQARYDRPDPRDWPKGKSPFIWPVTKGTLTSRFGPRGDSFHDGIDIGAPKGTLIRAARSGEVLYDDSLRGYGNVIILRHDDDYATVYAHNSGHLVRVGDRVRQGQPIARLGDSGRTSGPNLHFEVRKKNVARNPLYYLPRPGAAAGVPGHK